MNDTVAALMNVPGVKLAAVVGRDGRIQAVSHAEPLGEALAGLASGIFGAMASALSNGGIAPLESCLLEAGNTAVQLQAMGDKVLVALTEREANVGRVKLALRRAAEHGA